MKKRYTIQWKYSRIEEDKNSPIQDMDYVINSIIAPGQPSRDQSSGMASPQAYVGASMDSTSHSSPTIGESKNSASSGDVKITGGDLF